MRIIKFGAEWCSACRVSDPILDDLRVDYPIEYVDVDKQEDEAFNTFKIRNIPAVIILNGEGNEVERLVGAKTKVEYSEIFKKHFNRYE